MQDDVVDKVNRAGNPACSWQVRKGLLETILRGAVLSPARSGGESGGMGGFTATLLGDSRGGRLGGGGSSASCGEPAADLTVLTEAVEEMESELEVTLSFEGEIGDLPVPRSSVLELSFPFTSRRPAGAAALI